MYAAVAWVRERGPFAEETRSVWRRAASIALALAFTGLGVMVIVDAGPARRPTLLLLGTVAAGFALIILRRRRHA
jgi:hypothetical protein